MLISELLDLFLDFVKSDGYQLILSLLSLDLFFLVSLLLFQILNICLNSIDFSIVFVFQIEKAGEFVFVPEQLLLHSDDPLVVVQLVFLLFSFVFEQLKLFLDFAHVSLIS